MSDAASQWVMKQVVKQRAKHLISLREMQTRLRDGRAQSDPSQLDIVDKMMSDLICELEPKIPAKKNVQTNEE